MKGWDQLGDEDDPESDDEVGKGCSKQLQHALLAQTSVLRLWASPKDGGPLVIGLLGNSCPWQQQHLATSPNHSWLTDLINWGHQGASSNSGGRNDARDPSEIWIDLAMLADLLIPGRCQTDRVRLIIISYYVRLCHITRNII